MFDISFHNQQSHLEVDEDRLRTAAERILSESGITAATVSIAVVDDAEIHELNRNYLAHDYPTDVLSFVLESGPGELEGQIVVSAEMALAQADCFGWSAANELLLYVVHGMLHLVGHDDASPEAAARMRAAEREFLQPFGVVPRYDEDVRGATGSHLPNLAEGDSSQ
ncbi:MAG: rRNA maturation RNase YbeY [Pirellulales bacterium]